jgi:hypothetical protein
VRLLKMTGILALGGIQLLAGKRKDPAKPIVVVCVSYQSSVDIYTEQMAWAIATRMLGRVGVSLVSKQPAVCPADGIHIALTDRTPESFYPGALAFALPFEGTHIRVFADRIAATQPKIEAPLMGHVYAHEIAHVLEGVAHHSASGVMKARWDERECVGMQRKDLPFDPEDVELIRFGLEARIRRAAAPMAFAATPTSPPY